MKKLSQPFLTLLTIFIVTFFVSSLIAYANWQAPVNSPPTCNANDPGCDPPINVGANLQFKEGWLSIANAVPSTGVGFTVLNGNVGIGTASPLQALHIFANQSNPLKIQNIGGGAGATAGILFTTFNTPGSANARIAAVDTGGWNGALAFYTDRDGVNNNNPIERMRVTDKLELSSQNNTTEGGEITLMGAGGNTTWNIDTNSGLFRVFTNVEKLTVNTSGKVKAGDFCIPATGADTRCLSTVGGTGGVNRIIAGVGIMVSPMGGTGDVTITPDIDSLVPMRIIRGEAAYTPSSGAYALAGEGFIVSRITGGMRVTFSTCFSGWPTVVATPIKGFVVNQNAHLQLTRQGPDGCYFDISSFFSNWSINGDDLTQNMHFSFTAIGPR